MAFTPPQKKKPSVSGPKPPDDDEMAGPPDVDADPEPDADDAPPPPGAGGGMPGGGSPVRPDAVNFHPELQRCDGCTHFGDQGMCEVLGLPVPPEGGCNAFDAADDGSQDPNAPPMPGGMPPPGAGGPPPPPMPGGGQ